MADHLDFIRIRGLESSDDEVFQGLGAAEISNQIATGSQTDGSAFDGVSEFFESIADSWETLWDFITGQATNADPGDDEETPRGRSRAIGALVPAVTSIVPLLSGLPAVIKGVAIFFVLPNIINAIVNDIEDVIQDQVDPNSIRSGIKKIHQRLNDIDDHLKTALIWEDGILGIDKSILGTSLMEGEASLVRIGIDDQRASLQDLKAAIESLQYNDEEIVIGDLHAYLRNKIVEY